MLSQFDTVGNNVACVQTPTPPPLLSGKIREGRGVYRQARNNDDFVAKNPHKKTLVYKRGFKIALKIAYRRWTSNSNHIKKPINSQISPSLFRQYIVFDIVW